MPKSTKKIDGDMAFECGLVFEPIYVGTDVHRDEKTLITKEMSAHFLSHNKCNRPVRRDHVEKIKRAIRAGRWHYNGDPIRFDSNGYLLDGQHRLLAIFETGIAVVADVMFGFLRKDLFEITNVASLPGNTGDILDFLGETNCKRLAATLGWIRRWEEGQLAVKRFSKPTVAEAVDVLNRHPEIRDSMSVSVRGVEVSLASALHYILTRVDKERADFFFTRLKDGADLPANSPIYHLRNRLEKLPEKRGVYSSVKIAYILQGWNAWRMGRSLQRMEFSEEIPKTVFGMKDPIVGE